MSSPAEAVLGSYLRLMQALDPEPEQLAETSRYARELNDATLAASPKKTPLRDPTQFRTEMARYLE